MAVEKYLQHVSTMVDEITGSRSRASDMFTTSRATPCYNACAATRGSIETRRRVPRVFACCQMQLATQNCIIRTIFYSLSV